MPRAESVDRDVVAGGHVNGLVFIGAAVSR